MKGTSPALALVLVALVGVRGEAATLRVPDDYRTLEAACTAARPGDEIFLSAGTHGPNVTGESFPARITVPLTLRGEGAGRTVLDGSDGSSVLRIDVSDDTIPVRIHGLSIERGRSASAGGAVRVDRGRVAFSAVRFSRNASAERGNAVFIADASVLFSGCLFDGNGERGVTLAIRSGELTVEHCTFAANAGPGLEVDGPAHVTCRNTIVADPGTPEGSASGIRLSSDAEVLLEDNLFHACFDGVLTGRDGRAYPAQGPGMTADGLRSGRVRFADPARGDFRVLEGDGAESLGAYAGASPLAERPPPRARDGAEHAASEAPALLGPNVPNPGNPGTTVQFTVPVASVVDLGIYNVLGQRVRSLLSGYVPAGDHRQAWDGRDDLGEDLPPGIYFIRVTQGGATESRRLVLVR